MRLKFKDKRISGILAVVPEKSISFDEEMSNYEFPVETSLKLKATMGYNCHRIVGEGTTVGDLAIYGMRYLIDNNMLDKDDLDALILVTETPDYIVPPTSNIIQGELGLKEDMICLDINQGCAGYEVGLIEAFMLLEQEEIKKVALVNAEVLSHKTSRKDRNSFPLIGDGCAITIVERSDYSCEIFANIKMDGKGAFAIQIPAGGIRKPSTAETAIEEKDSFGNWRSENNLVMKGDEVFMFVQKKVPPLINDILEYSQCSKDEIAYYMFHQPNKFMLNKLASKLKISKEKMPSNIVETFGNSSGVTVPLNICYNLGERMKNEDLKLCIAGFGVGLVWASMVFNIGHLDFCKLIEYPEP